MALSGQEQVDKAAFEKAIADNPRDGDLRQAFGDWLEEHGLDDEASYQHSWTLERYEESESFIKRIASEAGTNAATLMDAARQRLTNPTYFFEQNGYHDLSWLEDDMKQFWQAAGFLLGHLDMDNKGRPIRGCCDRASEDEWATIDDLEDEGGEP